MGGAVNRNTTLPDSSDKADFHNLVDTATLDLTAPGAIGGTTPAAGAFTTISGLGATTLNDAANATLLTIDNDGTGLGLYLSQDGISATTKHGAHIYSNAAIVAADAALVKIHMDNAAASEPALEIDNDGTGIGLSVTQDGSGSAIGVANNGIGGHGLNVSQNAISTTGLYGLRVYSNAALTNADTPLAKIIMDNAGSSEPALEIQNDGTGPAIEVSDGDIRNVAWVDYSGTSTIVGWAATPTSTIMYKKVGNLVFCCFNISGTSNATTVSFTLPYTAADTEVTFGGAMRKAIDNTSGITGASCARLLKNSATVQCYSDMYEAAWTNSGIKATTGSIWYEATT